MAKSKYDECVKPKLILIEGWARDGLTIEQICHNLDISKTTFYKYMEEHFELSERLKKGKEVIDIEVENALLKRALGYTFNEVTQEKVLNKETGEYELQVTKVVKKEVNPDTTAQIFWLKNRKPKQWRDKQEIEHSGETNMNVTTMTAEERKQRIEQLKQKLNEDK